MSGVIQSMTRRGLLTLLAMTWCAGILAAYHFRPGGFPPGPLPRTLIQIAMVAFIAVAAAEAGRWALRPWRASLSSDSLRIHFEVGAGLGFLALVTLALAAASLLRGPVILALVAIPAAAWCGRRIVARRPERQWDAPESPAQAAGKAILAIAALASLVASLAPPEFYDALIYHLAVPAAYLRHNGIVVLPGNYYALFPANMGMLYAIGLALAGPEVAQALHWLCGGIAAAALYAVVKRHAGKPLALLATLIFALNPGVLLSSTQAGSDLAVTMFGVLAFAAVLERWRSGDHGWAKLAGLFGGLAMGVKYTALISVCVPAALGLLITPLAGKARSASNSTAPKFRGRLACVAVFSVTAALVVSPWLVRNQLLAGHPLAPYFGEQAGAGPSLSDEFQRRLPRDSGPMEILRKGAAAPWVASMERLGHAGYLGPIFLALIPLLPLLGRSVKLMRPVGIMAAAGFVGWAFTTHVTRYLFPIIPLLAILAAMAATRLPRWLACLAVGWPLLYGVGMFGLFMGTIGPYRVASGVESREEYLARTVSYYQACRYIDTLPAGPRPTRTLFVGEGRVFHCEGDVIAATPFNRPATERYHDAAVGEAGLLAALRADDITHLLVSDPELRRTRSTTANAEMSRLFPSNEPRMVFEAAGVRVYDLAGSPP